MEREKGTKSKQMDGPMNNMPVRNLLHPQPACCAGFSNCKGGVIIVTVTLGRGHTKETGNRNATEISVTCNMCSAQIGNSYREIP
jgi:hypothetical protein